MINQNPCPHQWTQSASFVPSWAQQIPKTMCTSPSQPVTPNPLIPITATLPTFKPLELKKISSRSILVTVSIPTETIFTLPTKALEIKMIRKNLKITQCRFFNFTPHVPGKPHDTPKLFLGGFVRKDIQYSEAIRQTAHTVEGTIKDFVIDIPYSCVVNLGKTLEVPPTLFDHQQEYEFLKSTPLSSGFSTKDKLLSADLSEFNTVSNEFFNALPSCTLIYSQINEMDDALDREPLPGGPFEEGLFQTVQEKMTILIQLKLTFPVEIDPPTPCK